MTSTEATTGVPFTLNGKELEAEQGELLIDACERNGVHIPRFCYHPRMTPVGMCRMCLVEVDTGRGSGLQPSCMLPVTPEMKVETESEATKQAQDGVLEFLLANHPLDCPVCDKGGECPLQDNAYAFGPGESRYVEEKRHYEKPIPISDLVHLDRERCILCDRCTRFASEVAGDPLIHFIGRGSHTQVNTFPDHPFSSYFSGNTVQICPVGALTASPYRFKARPWDLEAVESTATVDSVGSRILVQSTRNELVRIIGVDSDAVNHGWLSDKERFSYEATNSDERITEPQIRKENGQYQTVRWSDAARTAVAALSGPPDRVAVIGGARLTMESQYAWAKLAKGVVGTDHVDAQMGDGLPAALTLGLPRGTIDEACRPGGVVVLMAPDPKEELPSLYLRLRRAVVEDGVTLIEITPRDTSLSELAAVRLRCTPGTVGQVLAAIAEERLDDPVGGVDGFQLRRARSLLTSSRPVSVIYGRPNLAESARYVADAVGGLRRVSPEAKYLPALRRGNVNGALEVGLTPGFLPGGSRNKSELEGVWPTVPDFDGKETDGILRAAAAGEIDTLVLLGADPVGDYPDTDLAAQALERVTTIIAVDCFETASSALAHVRLPAAMFGEVDGTFCNLEGRLSPIRAKVTPPGLARPDWMIAAELAAAIGPELGADSLEQLRQEMAEVIAGVGSLDWDGANAPAGALADGPLIRTERNWDLEFGEAAQAPAPGSSGLRLVVDRKLWDNGTMVQRSPSLAGLVSEAELRMSPTDVQLMGLGDSRRVTVGYGDQSFDLTLAIDPAVTPRTAWVSIGLPGFDARQLLGSGRSVTNIEVQAAAPSPESTTGEEGR